MDNSFATCVVYFVKKFGVVVRQAQMTLLMLCESGVVFLAKDLVTVCSGMFNIVVSSNLCAGVIIWCHKVSLVLRFSVYPVCCHYACVHGVVALVLLMPQSHKSSSPVEEDACCVC